MHKQDLRVLKTIRQIDNSLLSVLKKTSFDRITVDMLCKEAMINRSTFYRYYEDKYDLLNNFMNRILNDFRSCAKVDFVHATAMNVSDPVYQSLFSELLKHIAANKDTYLTLSDGSVGRNIWDEMAEIIQENIFRELRESKNISAKNEKYIRLYSRLFATDLISIILWWFDYYDDLSIADVIVIMTDNISNGCFKAFKEYL